MARRPGTETWQHAYRKRVLALRAEVKRKGLPCWICGRAFDLTLPPTHPHSFTADHVVPVSRGGKLLGELRPACRSCNSRRGAGRATAHKVIEPPRTSRAW